MSGRWRVDPSEVLAHDHLIVGDGHCIALALGDLEVIQLARSGADRLARDLSAFLAMGPEPLGPVFSARYLLKALDGRIASVKLMLLDQQIVAGLGSAYVCEALHLAVHRADAAWRARYRWRGSNDSSALRTVLGAALGLAGLLLRDYSGPGGGTSAISASSGRFMAARSEPCGFAGKVGRYSRRWTVHLLVFEMPAL